MGQDSGNHDSDTSDSSDSRDSSDMTGSVCLVTGATSGIGLATARALARRGATVALVGRSEPRARAVVEDIRRQTNNTRVDYLLADLSAQAAVRELAETFRRRYGALHVLVNNAGAIFMRRQQTVDGLEMTLALNHLAPFLLTNLLLDLLRASAPARVVTVASEAHRGATIPFDNLQQTRGRYAGFRVYGQSKLANILFTYELARRLSESGDSAGVTANALHPGFVASGFNRNNGLGMRIGMTIVRPFAISPAQGAETPIYLASSPDVARVSGEYFIKCKPARSSPASYDETAQQQLWQVSEQLTGLT